MDTAQLYPDIAAERILICGPRDWTAYLPVLAIVGGLKRVYGPDITIIEGLANGVDKLAGSAAIKLGLKVKEFPADWRGKGRSAGPQRNREMLEKGRPDLIVACGFGAGTAGMVGIARAAGKPVVWRYVWWRGASAT